MYSPRKHIVRFFIGFFIGVATVQLAAKAYDPLELSLVIWGEVTSNPSVRQAIIELVEEECEVNGRELDCS